MGQTEQDVQLAREVLLCLAETGYEWTETIRRLPDGDLLSSNLTVVLLCHLSENEWLRPVQLRESVDITSGGMSKLIDRLEDAGLVARLSASPPDDRRGVEVALTKKGSSALNEVLEAIAPFVAQLIRDLGDIAAEHGMSSEQADEPAST